MKIKEAEAITHTLSKPGKILDLLTAHQLTNARRAQSLDL